MEKMNEAHPLLRSSAAETWMKRSCNIPGLTLGLCIIFVTLILVIQKFQAPNKNDFQLPDQQPLLASPLKFHKKAINQSWQEIKEVKKDKGKHQNWNEWDKDRRVSVFPGLDDQSNDSNKDKHSVDRLHSSQNLDDLGINDSSKVNVWKIFLKPGWKGSNLKEALMNVLKDTEGVLDSPADLDKFYTVVVDTITELQKNWKS